MFTGDKPGSFPVPLEFGVDSNVGTKVTWETDESAGAAVKVDMTTLFPSCWLGVAGGAPQEARIRRNNPAKRETWFFDKYFFMLTSFPFFDSISLKLASYMTIEGLKRYITDRWLSH